MFCGLGMALGPGPGPEWLDFKAMGADQATQDSNGYNSPPNPDSTQPFAPRSVANIFEAQLALAAIGFSCGSIDGISGFQTQAALLAYQKREGLPLTGTLNSATKARLRLEEPAWKIYRVTEEDQRRLRPLSPSWRGKSRQDGLDYETILELVAEKHLSHPNFIRRSNLGIDWHAALAGKQIRVPNVTIHAPKQKADLIRIQLSSKTLKVYSENEYLIAHYPCSIARRIEKRPLGLLAVVNLADQPNYCYNPDLFPQAARNEQLTHPLMIPPGPNNPVGVAWIGLNRSGYGIHGTPAPEKVGRTESMGCFRLANWNAAHLLKMTRVGMPVYIEQ